MGLVFEPFLGRGASVALWATQLPAWFLVACVGGKRFDKWLALNSGMGFSGALVHFAEWPWELRRGVPTLIQAEGMTAERLPAYNAILQSWVVSGALALLFETPRDARRWALLGIAMGEPLRRSAAHHFRWAREQARKEPEKWSPALRAPAMSRSARIEGGCTLSGRAPIQDMSTEPKTSPAGSEQATGPSPDAIMQLGTGFWASKTLLSAVELGLFYELATAGALDGDALRARLGLHERSAHDFFDALVALGMLERENGLYRNTPATDFFLDRAKPTYIGGMLEMMNARLFGFWNSLTEGLRTGEPQNEIKTGGNFFEVLYSNPDKLRGFLKAMSGNSIGSAMAISAAIPWDRYKTVIDVGCAEGCVPVQIALAHEHIGGGGFDLPAVKPFFEEYVAAAGLDDRLRFYPGDFFADDLPSADVLIMGHILHDWNLDEKKLLLGNAYSALPKGGALIVYEALIDDERRENAVGLLMSLNMLIETPGGFDYTGADCSRWMNEAGFGETYVEPLGGPTSMVVGIK